MDGLSRSYEELRSFLEAWPRLEGLLIVLISACVAFLGDRILVGILARWVRRTRTDIDDRILAALHRPVFASVLIVGLVLATPLFRLPWQMERITLGALKTIAVLVWLGFGFRAATLLLDVVSRHRERLSWIQPSTLPLFSNLAKIVLVGGGAYFLFLSWDVDLTAWLTSAGIIGVALGFAAKDTLANLFAGVFVLADAPYRVGDFINLSSGERGEVTHIGLRSTRLLTRDDIEITIPNAVIANAKIVNESGGRWPRRRVRVKVGVAYGSDVDQVRRVLLEVASSIDGVCEDPQPRVRLRSFADSALAFELLGWIDAPVLRGRILDALHATIYKRFREEGIEIPYPKRDVHVREMPDSP